MIELLDLARWAIVIPGVVILAIIAAIAVPLFRSVKHSHQRRRRRR